MKRMFGVAMVALCASAADRYIGAPACQTCHPAEFKSQSASHHAAALSRVADRANLDPGTLTRGAQYRFEILNSPPGLRVRINDAKDVMDLPLEWAFGAGSQAVTFVTRVNQDWYVEHYASRYTATRSYGPTPGQAELHPSRLADAAGVLYKTSDPQAGIKGCFECHSTGPVAFDGHGEAQIAETGVRCESCHGAGAGHATDPQHRKMMNPGRLSASTINEFCGKCHRPPPAKGVSIDWNYAWNVRHQPVYLSQSACFLKSRGKLSCLTCHDPHEPAARKPVAFFNVKCHGCHSGCTQRERTNCVDCHMPLVSPQPPLRFTNHWIGVYRTGSKLKPSL
jgi:hypothetical protein